MRLVSVIAIILVLASCRKDPEFGPADTTPYVFDYPEIIEEYLPPVVSPIDNPITEEGVELGRKLFYDTRLSINNNQACASCHFLTKSFSDTTQYSKGSEGFEGTRNAMPLFNLAWANKFFWDGRSNSLEEQAFLPVVDPVEMHETWPQAVAELQDDPDYPVLFEQVFGTAKIDSTMVAYAIAQFERTLIVGNAPFDRYLLTGSTGWSAADELAAYQGFALFNTESTAGGADCFHCHGDAFNPLWTDNQFRNNGLDATFADKGLGNVTGNPNDDGKFKTPSLRQLVFTAPYMHDGRFNTLDEVINHYSEGVVHSSTIDPNMKNVDDGGVQLTPEKKYYLKMFLISLSDSSFNSNPAYSDPW